MESVGEECPFCGPIKDRVFYENELVFAIWDAYPVTPGHALLIPKRHIPTWFDATTEERHAIFSAVDEAKRTIDRSHQPHGYNIGINCGNAAGQTVLHLHVHLIPRLVGDVVDPRGGVRYVIPQKANYLQGVSDRAESYGAPQQMLSTGATDPLLPFLKEHLSRAVRVDIAVAFALPGGVELIWAHLQEVLDRGGSVRLLTGDYLDCTDPDALLRLLDLESDLPGAIELRVFETRSTATSPDPLIRAFHPKTYIFFDRDGAGSAFVGSSNLSATALFKGVEWNYRIVSSRDRQGFREVATAFDRLFTRPETTDLTASWVQRYRARRDVAARANTSVDPTEVASEPVAPPPEPHAIQRAALDALTVARSRGVTAGLVVLATGLGKTWLSAFDSAPYQRILFIAHREEILRQSLSTFRRVRPHDTLGHFAGEKKERNAAVLFASVQTLSKRANLENFFPNDFDYIVIDEFHHASAATYRRLLEYFKPKFLLGLTATPERTDGADLLDLCGGHLIYRCDLPDGIRQELLAPFSYFGVPDEVDYKNIPWRSTKFDEEALTRAVATSRRAKNALDQLRRRGGKKTLSFCVSQSHADFMAEFFTDNGVSAVSVHSGATSAPRTESLERLANGELTVVFAVDMFNEGVDIPTIDTILMLRPTESKILWLQQFGRGLRKSSAEKRLVVIDYIGNHRTFLLKPQTLFNLPPGDAEVQQLLEKLDAGTADLPPGCEVTYELEAKNILRGLLRTTVSPSEALRTYIADFRDIHGIRPTALEAFRDGFNPGAVRANFGSWLGFLQASELLTESELEARLAATHFLEQLEITPMTKSFKMAVLLSMLNADQFPGAISIAELRDRIRAFVANHGTLRPDFEPSLDDNATLTQLLEQNPIKAWTEGRGTGARSYFQYSNESLATTLPPIADHLREEFQSLTRELAEWRLAQYLEAQQSTAAGGYILKVSHADGKPILFLPDRGANPGLPEGWTSVQANKGTYEANVVKVAINVVRQANDEKNALPSLLRGWFGPDAGAPGTRHQVRLEKRGDAWCLDPLGVSDTRPVAWNSYSREQIPRLFDLEFNRTVWQQGFLRRGNLTFLLVTLDKSTHADEHKYEDRFETPERFRWQSQNRTKQVSKDGKSIHDHLEMGIEVHLFVRPRSKTPAGTAMAFVYCGMVEFMSWKGNSPITVQWRLKERMPERIARDLVRESL